MESDKITYWESRQINIGDFDNRSFGISYAKNINLKEKTININAKVSAPVEELDESIKFVSEKLDKLEAEIRERTDSFVTHDSIIKIPNEDDKDDAIEKRHNRRQRSREGAQRFKDKIRGKNFLDE